MYASTNETTGCGVAKDCSYETPPGTLALPATDDLLPWITFTVQVPKVKLWKVTMKPFALEIDGTEMNGSGAGLGLPVVGLEGGVGDGVTAATGWSTCNVVVRWHADAQQSWMVWPPIPASAGTMMYCRMFP